MKGTDQDDNRHSEQWGTEPHSDHHQESLDPQTLIDPVEEASRESFPASDPPGWISKHAEELTVRDVVHSALERLQALAASKDPQQQIRYRSILAQRDYALTQAVAEAAQALLKASGYNLRAKDNQQAIALMADYLSDSSISDIDQRLMALVGTKALFGYRLESWSDDDSLRLFPTGTQELDALVALRLARALNRSRDQEGLLWQMISDAINLPPEGTEMVKGAISALLDEIPISEVDDALGAMIVKSVMGG